MQTVVLQREVTVAPLDARRGTHEELEAGSDGCLDPQAAGGVKVHVGATRRARVDADRAIVLLTDGRPTAGYEEVAVAAASQARAAAIATWVIGLGGDLDAAYLARLAGAAGRVRVAPGAADLEAVYRQVASTLLCR